MAKLIEQLLIIRPLEQVIYQQVVLQLLVQQLPQILILVQQVIILKNQL
jgi:hypothetical protein